MAPFKNVVAVTLHVANDLNFPPTNRHHGRHHPREEISSPLATSPPTPTPPVLPLLYQGAQWQTQNKEEEEKPLQVGGSLHVHFSVGVKWWSCRSLSRLQFRAVG